MPKVIIIDNPRKDFDNIDQLCKFGDVINIRRKVRSVFRTEEFEKSLYEALVELEFNPFKDYMVIIGRQIQVTLGVTAVFKRYGRVKVLMYSHGEETYVERMIH